MTAAGGQDAKQPVSQRHRLMTQSLDLLLKRPAVRGGRGLELRGDVPYASGSMQGSNVSCRKKAHP
jgi:hypothetical protein